MQESIDWDRCINRLTVGLWLLWNARKPIPNETDVVLSRKFMDSASTDKIDPELIQSIRREEEETPQSLESKAPIEPTIHVADKTFPSSPKQDEKLSQKTTEETIQPIKAKPESTSSVAFGELNLSNETTKKSSPEATPVRTEATNENRNNSPIPAPSKNFSPQRKSGMDDKEEHFTPRSSVEAPLFVEDKLRKEAPKASAPKKEQKLSFTSATANNNKKSPEEASTVHGFLNQQSTTLPTKDTPLNEKPREKTSQSQNIVHPAPVTAKHESNQPSISVNGPRDQRQPSNVQKQTLPKEENNDKQEEKRKITTWICVIVIFSVLLIPILVAIFL